MVGAGGDGAAGRGMPLPPADAPEPALFLAGATYARFFIVSWIGMSLSILIVDPEQLASGLPRFELWFYLTLLLGLASMVYAALFSLFGVIVQRRAMVVAVGYFLVVELMLSILPVKPEGSMPLIWILIH